jgi:Fe2+ transport system protein FeoA
MCGFEFARDDTLCAHGCPLGALCNLLMCPNCEYEFPETPRRISWLRELLGRKESAAPHLPAGVRPVPQLAAGVKGEVLCLGGRNGSRYSTLSAFGLVQGGEVTLVQRRPSCVIRIGETELALDLEIAREILVKPLPASPSAHIDSPSPEASSA